MKTITYKGIQITEEDRLVGNPEVGEKYHVNWAHPGCVWKYTGFDGQGMVLLETPKTKKQIRTSIHSLRHINRNAYKNAKRRLEALKCSPLDHNAEVMMNGKCPKCKGTYKI